MRLFSFFFLIAALICLTAAVCMQVYSNARQERTEASKADNQDYPKNGIYSPDSITLAGWNWDVELAEGRTFTKPIYASSFILARMLGTDKIAVSLKEIFNFSCTFVSSMDGQGSAKLWFYQSEDDFSLVLTTIHGSLVKARVTTPADETIYIYF